MVLIISPATDIDSPKIKSFIEKVGAPEQVIQSPLIQFLTAKDHERELAAVLGIIREEEVFILRHLIIDPKRCDMEMLLEIIQNAVAFAASNKAKRVLFLTPASAELFEPLGFKETDRNTLEKNIQKHLPLYRKLPASAKILNRSL